MVIAWWVWRSRLLYIAPVALQPIWEDEEGMQNFPIGDITGDVDDVARDADDDQRGIWDIIFDRPEQDPVGADVVGRVGGAIGGIAGRIGNLFEREEGEPPGVEIVRRAGAGVGRKVVETARRGEPDPARPEPPGANIARAVGGSVGRLLRRVVGRDDPAPKVEGDGRTLAQRLVDQTRERGLALTAERAKKPTPAKSPDQVVARTQARTPARTPIPARSPDQVVARTQARTPARTPTPARSPDQVVARTQARTPSPQVAAARPEGQRQWRTTI